jgi:cell wall-associated NlpC family hydrolase
MGFEGIAAIRTRIREIEGIGARPALATMATTAVATSSAASASSTDFASLLAANTQPTTAAPGSAQRFLSVALAQQGKPYVYGATAQVTDPNPKAFDCSELTKWAAAQAGVTIPDGATAQYLSLRDQGATISVAEALRTPGALLFHFSHEPKNLGDIPPDGHVAISLGDGVNTIEARGSKYGTGVFAVGNQFEYAGVIPGLA